jgi:hypothetical protein
MTDAGQFDPFEAFANDFDPPLEGEMKDVARQAWNGALHWQAKISNEAWARQERERRARLGSREHQEGYY